MPQERRWVAGPGSGIPSNLITEVMTTSPHGAAVEMTLLWKSQTDSHRSLEISHRTPDSHIPTSRPILFQSGRT